MLPVASERLISARFLSTPDVLWFAPIVQRLSSGPLPAMMRAASRISCASTPVAREARSADQPSMASSTADQPLVRSSMKRASRPPASRTSKSSESSSATSEPGSTGRWMSAISAVRVRRGSTTITFTPSRSARFRALMRSKRIGWQASMFAPRMRNVFASSMSS